MNFDDFFEFFKKFLGKEKLGGNNVSWMNTNKHNNEACAHICSSLERRYPAFDLSFKNKHFCSILISSILRLNESQRKFQRVRKPGININVRQYVRNESFYQLQLNSKAVLNGT